MKHLKIITLAIVSSISFSALSSVELTANSSLELLVVNGENAKVDSSFFSSKQTAKLPNGENQIIFRYSYTYNRGDNYTRVDTPVIIAKFTAQDTNITFQFPEFRNAAEAGENIGNIRWSLIDSDKKVIEKAEDTLRIDGMQIGRNYVRETEDYNEAGGPAAIKSKRHTVSLPPTSTTSSTVSTSIEATSSVATAAAIEAIPKQATSTSNTPNADTAEEMLHFWYDKASPETKARFKEYVNQ